MEKDETPSELLEDDAIDSLEEGFMRGYNEEDEKEREEEAV